MLTSEQIDNWDDNMQLKLWNDHEEYLRNKRADYMSNGQLLEEFHTTFKSPRNQKFEAGSDLEVLATKLIEEEFQEFMFELDDPEKLLGELTDLVYVAYGYADRWGWDLDKAVRRKHLANMSKLDDNGQPIFREDGKVLKSKNFKPADLSDLV